jgi:hypothetical protein
LIPAAARSRGTGLAIHQMLRDAAFGPDEIACLVAAYEAALQLLRLTDRTDPVTQIVAKKIIEVYGSGEHDPPRICARAIKELGIRLPE